MHKEIMFKTREIKENLSVLFFYNSNKSQKCTLKIFLLVVC